MQDENRQTVNEAGPSVPVQVVGLSSVPEAGQTIHGLFERQLRTPNPINAP